MSATHKIVDGIRVELTQEEASIIEAEWAAEKAKPKPPPPRDLMQEIDDLEERIAKLETKQEVK